MKNKKLSFQINACIIILFLFIPFAGKSQGNPKVFFKEGDILRLPSNSKASPKATVSIIVPKNMDTSNKADIPNQDTLIGGKISIEPDKENSSVDMTKVELQVTNEFTIDSLKEQKEFSFTFTVPRDSNDDKTFILVMHVKNKTGEEIKELSKKITVYIKPLSVDTLRSNRNYELWLMTGTNFDLFDGVKAQEFFFRANTLFRMSDNFFGQVAFYKNRYYTVDTTSGSLPFTSVKRPGLGDSVYTLTAGDFKRTTKQTIDPLAFQFDVLYKIKTLDSISNFFVTAGFDFSTTTVTINNNYEFLDTTYYLKTTMPDTVKGYNNFGTTAFPLAVSYKKPTYNLNVGFMWILNDDEVNIKAHLTAGLSNYTNLLSFYQTKGAGIVYNFKPAKNIYVQMRMFATYKPLGLSFGFESFIRANEVPAFNFTLSKAFDIKGFIKNFTPVSGLKL